MTCRTCEGRGCNVCRWTTGFSKLRGALLQTTMTRYECVNGHVSMIIDPHIPGSEPIIGCLACNETKTITKPDYPVWSE